MKMIATFFVLIMLIGFVSCDTVTHYTIRIPVDRHPVLTIINQTGHPVDVITPVPANINDGARTLVQPNETNGIIDVIYRIGRMRFAEQVTMNNADAIVTLTRSPPTLTVTNNVGATINTIFLRPQNTPDWIGGNIVTRDGQVSLSDNRSATADEIGGSIVNRDSMQIWMGNIPIHERHGDIFDIRIDDVQRYTYVISNVQIRSDMTLTFTAADRR